MINNVYYYDYYKLLIVVDVAVQAEVRNCTYSAY